MMARPSCLISLLCGFRDGTPFDEWLIRANLKLVTRRAFIRRAEAPQSSAGVSQDGGNARSALRFCIRPHAQTTSPHSLAKFHR